ncbi:golgin subfamily A member 4 [Lacerta agilis]|uniref:golgin subfamily A member 4 n=1 Tax=Lacerta agilis TaxID=80427 RepID=UPI00141914B7|nr:golgin subfamily A member 4 [Lacerta agilis]
MKPAKVRIKDQPLYSSFNEKRKSKQGYEPGQMLLLPSVPTESVAQYSLALPSTNKDRVLDEMDVLKNITVHLNEVGQSLNFCIIIVHKMEGVYANEEIKEEEAAAVAAGEPTAPKEELEDMTTFLICCSQLSNQLDCALREEKQILESLLQWFEKEVHEMEEIGEEEIIPDWQIPVADKNISNNINKLLNRIQKLEDLKGRIQELPKLIQLSAPKHEKKKTLTPVAPAPKDPKHIIEELAMKHATEDVMNMVQVFQDDTGQQTMESMNNRMLEIMKVFERQTNKLHRVSNEQDVLEGKLQKIQQEFRKLAEEKEIMEEELQKMKGSEQEKGAQDPRKKMLSKLEKEKAKVEEKPPQVPVTVEKPARPTPFPLKHKEAENQKMKEDLAKAQANIQTLEQEKKMLEEKLQKALEEAEMAKIQLAEVPPTIPEIFLQNYTEIEDEKDAQKKGKKGTKPKGTDVQKLAVSGPDTGKAGETFPAKDVKQKRKGSFIDMDKALSEGQEKESEKRMEESRKTKAGKSEGADSKSAKSKDSAEIRKRRQTTKGAEKKTYDSPVSELPPSPQIEEKQLPALTKVVEETVSVTLDKSPEEVLPPDSKKRKTTSPELIVPEETTTLPTSEQEASSLLSEIEMEDAAQPKTIMRDTKRISTAISPEQATTLQKEIPQTYIDSSGLEEGGTKDLINKKMDQLVNNLAELEGVPEAETLAKLLLEPGKGMELLSDEQRLQLLNQLLPPDGLQQPGKPEEEQTEQKRQLLSNVLSTLQLLQQAHVPEDGLSEEEMNEMTEKKRALLANLDSNLKVLQPAEAVRPRQQDIDNEINMLTEKGSHLRVNLELNMRELEEAQALAATQPSEMSENKVKELLQQRELLTADLEQNMQDLQTTKALAAVLEEKDIHGQRLQELSELRKHLTEELKDLKESMQDMQEIELQASQRALFPLPSEKGLNELYELTEKKQLLLEKLASTKKELQEAQELAATQPGSVSEHKLQELAEQKRHLTADLEATLDGIQNVYRRASERTVFVRPTERKVYELSEKKQELLEKLESNRKQLEAAQALAIAQPGSISDHKLQELIEQRRCLAAELDSTVHEMQKARDSVSEGFVITAERELYELSAKKQELQQKLESNQKELLEAQALAVAEPGSISETKLRELAEQKELLSKELEETVCDIEEAKDRVSERAVAGKPPDMELQQLLMKKERLKEKLELNQKELEEAQALAAAEPSSINEHKLQLLTEQRKRLIADLKETVHVVKKAERRAADRTQQEPPVEMELYSLSIKKEMLQEMLEANQKELEEAQALAAAEPGSVSEHKLQELAEQRKKLTAELKATVYNIKKTQRRASQRSALEAPAERELFELAVKKQLLQANLESNWKELQEAQALAVTEPGSISEHKLQQLVEYRRRLTADLNEAIHEMQNAERRASEGAQLKQLPEIELYELSAKKELLQEKLESNQKELEAAQALAAAEPGSVNEHKLQELVEQRRNLTADLNATVSNIQKAQRRTSEGIRLEPPVEKELFELAVKKQRLQANLESNWKELQEAQTLAATEPGSISEHKLQQLTEERRLMTLDLKETMHNMQNAGRRASERALIESPTGRKYYDLLEKKQQLQANLDSNWEKLLEAETLIATQPGIISERKLEELAEERKRLTKELDATAEDILEAHRQASEKALFRKPAEKDLYALSGKKQMLLENLKGLQEAQALAATQSGIVGEEKRKQLAEQKQRLAADLEATIHDIQKAQRHVSVVPITMSPSEYELYELSQKKSLILESLAFNRKQLQEAQALAALHPGTDSDHKLEELVQERNRLTEDLREAVHSLHEIQRHSSQKIQIDSVEEGLEELAMKKRQLLQKLESNQKILEEAEVLEATHPGTISKHKLKEVAEERKRLTEELEEILHKMVLKEVQHHVSKPDEKEFYKLSEWKQHLLDNLESNLKELEETWALAVTQPGPSSDNLLKKLNEERRTLIENLERVVEDSQKMKSRLSERGGVIRPIEKDLSHLLQKKKLFLERLDSNLKNWLEAQTLKATEPSSINEKKFQHLTEERRLLAAGLEAIIQDIQNIQDADPEKQIKAREMALRQLYEKKKVFLENLRTNFRELREAQVLAAAEPGGVSELKVQELIHQRRLLTTGLDAIMQSMQEIEELIAGNVEIAKPSEIELDKIYEKRTLLLENMELNLQELKDLAKGGVSDKKIQAIAEKKKRLVSSFEAILQNMEEALSLDQGARTRPDERNISDLIELSNLESKLDEMQDLGVISGFQLDTIRKKMHKLKEQKKKMISKWEKLFLKEYPEGYIPQSTKKYKTPKELAGKGLFSYLQSSIKDLQEQGIIRQGSGSDTQKSHIGIEPATLVLSATCSNRLSRNKFKLFFLEVELDQLAEEKRIVDRYFEEVPIEFLPSEVAALSTQYEDEKSLKRRALAAKLEANIRDLQSALQVDKIEKPKFELPKSVLRTTGKRRVSLVEPSDQLALKPQLSGLQIHISKVPVAYRNKPESKTVGAGYDVTSQEEQDQLLKRNIELAIKGQLLEKFPESKVSLPQLDSSTYLHTNSNKLALEAAMQEILEFNKDLLPSHRANLQQALKLASYQLQQKQLQQQHQANALVEKFRNMPLFFPQPPGTARFQDYTIPVQKSGWETNQLPQKDYIQKLALLRRRILGPEMKGGGPSPVTQEDIQDQAEDLIVISGKGCNPYRKETTFPVIKQSSKHK